MRRRDDDGLHAALQGAYPAGIDLRSGVDALLYDPYLLSATFIPVEDCGCFGEAIKLSPWETFFKNLALLPMAAVVWAYYRNDKILAFRRSEVALTIFSSF